ncbi:MAG: hypothetical protein ACLR23_20790 [Clostridia bacterium]
MRPWRILYHIRCGQILSNLKLQLDEISSRDQASAGKATTITPGTVVFTEA